MIKKVKLKSISFNEGTSKKGRSYTMCFIEVGNTKASMYMDNEWHEDQIKEVKTWKEGEEKLLKFEKKGEYVNFYLPKDTDLLVIRIDDLEERVKRLENAQKAE